MIKYLSTRNQDLLVQNLRRYLFVPWGHHAKANSFGLAFGPWRIQAVLHGQNHAWRTGQRVVSGPMGMRPGFGSRSLSVDSQWPLFRWSYDSNKVLRPHVDIVELEERTGCGGQMLCIKSSFTLLLFVHRQLYKVFGGVFIVFFPLALAVISCVCHRHLSTFIS